MPWKVCQRYSTLGKPSLPQVGESPAKLSPASRRPDPLASDQGETPDLRAPVVLGGYARPSHDKRDKVHVQPVPDQ